MDRTLTETATITRPQAQPGTLRHMLGEADRFVIAMELETTRGLAMEESASRTLSLARRLAGSSTVDLVCITDNPGGNPHIRPEVMGYELLARGQEVGINFSCKDYNRNGLESRLWALGSMGFDNVLAVTGDYPVTGEAGGPQPVFDIDSVGLLDIIGRMNAGLSVPSMQAGRPPSRLLQTSFFPGVAINPFKLTEAELMGQYFKLAMKLRTGAAWAVTQIGYDSRKLDELLKYMALTGLDLPVLGSVYVLSAPAARFFHREGVPGIYVSDELLEITQAQSKSEDRGRAFFEELAAKQIAVLRGLGYRGAYLSGRLQMPRVRRILELEASFGPDDWRDFAREIGFQRPGEFNYFDRDPETGLASDRVNAGYLESKSPRALRRARREAPAAYRLARFGHNRLFAADSRGFRVARTLYRKVDASPTATRLSHIAEQAIKIPVFGCRDCGDCSLPEVAYLCPESQCVKNQRNGPCGGSRRGLCELDDRVCIWVKAYERLKPYGEEEAMLERAVVFKDGALQGTASWANTFLGRDHFHLGREAPEG